MAPLQCRCPASFTQSACSACRRGGFSLFTLGGSAAGWKNKCYKRVYYIKRTLNSQEISHSNNNSYTRLPTSLFPEAQFFQNEATIAVARHLWLQKSSGSSTCTGSKWYILHPF